MKPSAFVATLAAALTLTVSGSALAQGAVSPLYLRVDAGYAWSKDAEIRDNGVVPGSFLICGNAPCTSPGSLNDIGDSYVIGAGVGYRVAPNIRAELAVAYRGGFELDEGDVVAPTPTTFQGKIRSWNAMLNGYYDFDFGAPWKPYVMAGIGAARNKFKTISGTNPSSVTLPAFFSNFQLAGDSETSFAWQLGLGVGYAISAGRTLEFGYRYVDLGDLKIPAQVVSNAPAYAGAKGELKSHEITLGFRF
jgi:opacity protein-like surface antigen